jgi:hypothetical protein
MWRPSRYLIRFDDICPTMNWAIWEDIEALLDEHGVKPIVAVIPDNQDRSLQVDPPNRAFWSRVRDWQAKGWGIGLHGYQHVVLTPDGGILGIHCRSEFAGLTEAEQRSRLARGLAIFRNEGVRPDIWVAPFHSFDRSTLFALKDLGIDVVSDGMGFGPWIDQLGLRWIPQQLGTCGCMPFGLWTICHHHNGWNSRHSAEFKTWVVAKRASVLSLGQTVQLRASRRKQWCDPLIAYGWRQGRRLYRSLATMFQSGGTERTSV